jgi:hypothetical protein
MVLLHQRHRDNFFREALGHLTDLSMDLDLDLMLLDLNFIISNAADSFGQAKRLIEDF